MTWGNLLRWVVRLFPSTIRGRSKGDKTSGSFKRQCDLLGVPKKDARFEILELIWIMSRAACSGNTACWNGCWCWRGTNWSLKRRCSPAQGTNCIWQLWHKVVTSSKAFHSTLLYDKWLTEQLLKNYNNKSGSHHFKSRVGWIIKKKRLESKKKKKKESYHSSNNFLYFWSGPTGTNSEKWRQLRKVA